MPNSFNADQSARLHAFREAALQVRNASVIDSGATISMSGRVDKDGNLEQSVMILANEAFRSFSMSLRLIYMNDAPANFGSICNLLRSAGPAALHPEVDAVRARYNSILNGSSVRFGLHGDFEGTVVGPREIFENWLYYGSFHHDLSLKSMFDELSKFGAPFVFAVNAVALSLAGCVLALDDIVAHALDEPQMPRIR